jgi:hypothetical protein
LAEEQVLDQQRQRVEQRLPRGIWLKRCWGGEARNVEVLVVVGVNQGLPRGARLGVQFIPSRASNMGVGIYLRVSSRSQDTMSQEPELAT